MAKRESIIGPLDPVSEAEFLESRPHGSWHGHETREGECLEPDYTHRHNPAQHDSRSLVSDPAGRQRREPDLDDGYSFNEPMRADLDDDVR